MAKARFILFGGMLLNVDDISYVHRESVEDGERRRRCVTVHMRKTRWHFWADDEAEQNRLFERIKNQLVPAPPPLSPVVSALATEVFERTTGIRGDP